MNTTVNSQNNILVIPDNVTLFQDITNEKIYTIEAIEIITNFLDKVSKRNSIETSVLGLTFKDRIIDLNQIPYPDLKWLHYDNGSGYVKLTTFETAPTYLELWKAAETVIEESADEDRVYIEGFNASDLEGVYSLFVS